MKKKIFFYLCFPVFLSSCSGEFNKVYKSTDKAYKYEYAKECFAKGKFDNSIALLQDIVTYFKGTDNAQESLYLLGMAQFSNRDYESASETFRKYYSTYPKSDLAENASFYIGESLFMSVPEPRLDQTLTISAMNAYQQFMDNFPESKLRKAAEDKLFKLQDNLVEKEYLSAKLYYDLGGYFLNCTTGGSNYEACIITSQNALKEYPYSDKRELFSLLIMKSKFELARQSVEAKREDRYRDAEDECYGFINEYPDSKDVELAHKYIERCKKELKN